MSPIIALEHPLLALLIELVKLPLAKVPLTYALEWELLLDNKHGFAIPLTLHSTINATLLLGLDKHTTLSVL